MPANAAFRWCTAWSPIWGSKRLYQAIYIFQVINWVSLIYPKIKGMKRRNNSERPILCIRDSYNLHFGSDILHSSGRYSRIWEKYRTAVKNIGKIGLMIVRYRYQMHGPDEKRVITWLRGLKTPQGNAGKGDSWNYEVSAYTMLKNHTSWQNWCTRLCMRKLRVPLKYYKKTFSRS